MIKLFCNVSYTHRIYVSRHFIVEKTKGIVPTVPSSHTRLTRVYNIDWVNDDINFQVCLSSLHLLYVQWTSWRTEEWEWHCLVNILPTLKAQSYSIFFSDFSFLFKFLSLGPQRCKEKVNSSTLYNYFCEPNVKITTRPSTV